MSGIEIVAVDERDSSWERYPRLRVYLFDGGGDFAGGSTWTYDLTGADVLQAIDWAQRKAGHSMTYAVALVYDDLAEEHLDPGCARGLIWLVGMDGNDGPWDQTEEDVQRRMVARSSDPVGVPAADRMPAQP